MKELRNNKKAIVTGVALLYVLGLLGYLYFHYRSFVSLQIEANRAGKAVIGKVAGEVPGSFAVSAKKAVVRVFAPGCVESVVTTRFPGGGKCHLFFKLAPAPAPKTIPEGSYCAFPAYDAERDTLYYLGHHGASFVALVSGSRSVPLNDDKLAQIQTVKWSPDARHAILRVEPAGDGLVSMGSPIACSAPSSFIYNTADNSFHPIDVPSAEGSSFDKSGRLYFGTMEGDDSVVCSSEAGQLDPGGKVVTDNAVRYNLRSDILVPYCYPSPDGRYVAVTPTPGSNMSDSELGLLDTGKNVLLPVDQSGYVFSAAWSPDSRYLLFEKRDPVTQVPTVHAYDTEASGFTPFAANTYLAKLTFFSNTTVVYGKPRNIERALAGPIKTTPDSLVYSSVLTGNEGTIITASAKSSQNFTHPILSGDRNTLYYSDSLFLRYLDMRNVLPVIDRFEESQKSPDLAVRPTKGGGR